MSIARSAVGSWRTCRAVPAALLLVVSCSERSSVAPDISARASASRSLLESSSFVVEPTIVTVPTYDGSGQSVHPDVVAFDSPWHGAKYWLTMTPYPKSNQVLENPSILTSDDGESVAIPSGLTNPVIKPPKHSRDYNSDPELLYEPQTDRLVMFYRLVEKKTNTVHVSASSDGIHWKPVPAPFWVRYHQAVSPTIGMRTGAAAKMWYVQAGKDGCDAKRTKVVMRAATNPTGAVVDTKWNGETATDLSIPGYEIWHIKARWIPSKAEYWMLISAYPDNGNGCKTDDLFFAKSSDGTHWSVSSEPLLRHEDRAWTAAAVYRTSFLYDEASDELSLWISARGMDGAWRMGYARVRYDIMQTMLDAGRRMTPPSATRYHAPAQLLGEEP